MTTALLASLVSGLWVGAGPNLGWDVLGYATDDGTNKYAWGYNGFGWGLGLEGGYLWKGQGPYTGFRYESFSASYSDSQGSQTHSRTYFVIPLMLSLSIPKAGNVGADADESVPHLDLGMELLFARSGRLLCKDASGNTICDEPVPSDSLDMDYAFAARAGLAFILGPVVLDPTVHFRWVLTPGLSSRVTTPGVTESFSQWETGLFINIAKPF